jgi:hypothetical protein
MPCAAFFRQPRTASASDAYMRTDTSPPAPAMRSGVPRASAPRPGHVVEHPSSERGVPADGLVRAAPHQDVAACGDGHRHAAVADEEGRRVEEPMQMKAAPCRSRSPRLPVSTRGATVTPPPPTCSAPGQRGA